MNNNKLLLIIVAFILLGLLSAIWINRKFAEKKKAKIERKEERYKLVQDSLIIEKEKLEIRKKAERKIAEGKQKKAEELRLIEKEKISKEKRIDGYTNKSDIKFDVAILITNDNNQIVNDLILKIANLYRNQGHSVTSSLFTSSFIQSKYLPELQNSSGQVIDMLNLNVRTKYVVIGKINYSFRKGTVASGTIICSAKITINIISVNQKSIKNGFSISVNGNGVSESQAQEKAQQLLINKYNTEYSSL